MSSSKAIIKDVLDDLAYENGIDILYAGLFGSRSFGFSHTSSDWDIRFIYRRKTEDYISVNAPEHHIEKKVEIEGHPPFELFGIDLFKFCSLGLRRDGQLYEWSTSMYNYEEGIFHKEYKALIRKHLDCRKAFEHHRGMSKKQVDIDMNTGLPKTVKKFVYLLRSLIYAIHFVDNERPPIVNLPDAMSSIMNNGSSILNPEKLNILGNHILYMVRRNYHAYGDSPIQQGSEYYDYAVYMRDHILPNINAYDPKLINTLNEERIKTSYEDFDFFLKRWQLGVW